MSYINSTLIFCLDSYPLILKITDRNNVVFKTVHASLPRAESFTEQFSKLCWEIQNIFTGKLPGSTPELLVIRAVSNTFVAVVLWIY